MLFKLKEGIFKIKRIIFFLLEGESFGIFESFGSELNFFNIILG